MSEAIAIKTSHLSPPGANRADVWSCFRRDLDKLLDRVEATLDLPSLRGHVEHLWPQASLTAQAFQVSASENNAAYTIDVMLPGVAAKDVDVTLGGAYLDVQLRSEDCTKILERTFALPDSIRQDAITAALHAGVLSIVLPKAQADSAQRKIGLSAA